MQDQHHSDFLPWALAVAAVLIMAVAVVLNAGESGAQRPQTYEQAHANR
jgi:hypothetical protein